MYEVSYAERLLSQQLFLPQGLTRRQLLVALLILLMPSGSFTQIPRPHEPDVQDFSTTLLNDGLLAALRFLNNRTPHRHTGVFRFDGDMLRNVALVDKWDAAVNHGEDVPIAAAYCAHLHATGEPLEVADGATDHRVPWMSTGAIVSYCGAVIFNLNGQPWGALCHFDVARCDAKDSDMPLLVAAAKLIHEDTAAAVSRL